MKNASRLLGLLLFLTLSSGTASGASWKTEFEDICVHTIEAPSLSTERIRELIDESDRLMKTIEKGKDPQKKVYLFRLKKCRNFFLYILESRDAGKNNAETASPGD